MSCDSGFAGSDTDFAPIVLTPDTLALTPGMARAIDAVVLDAGGAPMPNGGLHWSVENVQVASVSAQGVVTAIAAGATQVAASKAGKSARATIIVSALPPALVRVSPTTSNVSVGGRITLSAEVRDAGGGIMTNHRVLWSSANPTIASVNQRGMVRGLLPGNAAITATAAGLVGSAVVSVFLVPVAAMNVARSLGAVAPERRCGMQRVRFVLSCER